MATHDRAAFLAIAALFVRVASAQVSAPATFSTTVAPVLQARCAACHGGESAEAGLRLDSYERLLAGSASGQAVIPFDADGSLLVRLAGGQAASAPHPSDVGAEPLTDDELETLRAWVADGARADDGSVPYSGDRDVVYACNQGAATISVIDAVAQVVVRTIDLQKLGFPPTSKPHHAAVEPDGSYWYVTLIGANRVLKFNRDNEIVGSVEFEVPGLLALDPDSDRLFVGRSMSAVNPPQSIGMIRRTDMTLVEVLDVFFPRPHALALSPDGGTVYAASLAENRMIAIDVVSGDAQLSDLDGPVHTLVQFATNPIDGTLVAGGQMTARLFVFEQTPDGLLSPRVRTEVGAQPWHPVFGAGGSTVWIPNKGANAVTALDAATGEVRAVIEGEGLAQPHGSALSMDGRWLFVSNTNMEGTYEPRYAPGAMMDHSGMHEMPGMSGTATLPGTVVVIDTQSNRIVKVLEIGLSPSGMGSRGLSRARQ